MTADIRHRVARELELIQSELEDLGAHLCADASLVFAHLTQLQRIDEIAQRQRHLAEILLADDGESAIKSVSLAKLKKRLNDD